MKSFKKFVESYQPVNEAEYNKEWWDSKSDSFKKRYIEKHPNSVYAQKAKSQPSKKASKSLPKGGEKDTISVDDLEKIRNKSGNVSLNKLRSLIGLPKLPPYKKDQSSKKGI